MAGPSKKSQDEVDTAPHGIIRIRETIPEDLPAIFRIRNHPLVQSQQYPLIGDDSVDGWTTRLFDTQQTKDQSFRCATILSDTKVIGHVMQHYFGSPDCRACSCGWNLEPDYWGRGLMGIALTELFDQLFQGQEQLRWVFADCFRNNYRCRRLLQKLGFTSFPIPTYARLSNAWQTRCWRWVLRHRLSAATWYSARMPDAQRLVSSEKQSESCSSPGE